MTLHDDLLRLFRNLARSEAGDQASLRRAVLTSYYVLFYESGSGGQGQAGMVAGFR